MSLWGADLAKGKKLYRDHCANCHGNTGRPEFPDAPNFRRGEGLRKSDVELARDLKTGKMMSILRVTALAWFTLVFTIACSDQSTDSGSGSDSDVVEAIEKEVVLEGYQVGPNVYVRSLKSDPAANRLWVGTSGGVMEIDLASNQPVNTFTRDHGLANEYVFAIGLDSDGYKWFGTNAGGVSRYKEGEWETFFPMHGLADYWVYTFAEQANRAYWIGTWAGVNRFDLDTGEMTTYVEELINEWVYGIGIDSKDQVWFGTEGGVTMFDGNDWVHWTHEDGLGIANYDNLPISPNTGLGTRSRHDLSIYVDGQISYNPNYIFAVHVDPEDRVWVGTWGGGVAVYSDGKWENHGKADGLAGNIVYSIAQDQSGAMWFGTNEGLSRLADDGWRTYGTADGLLGEHVYAIEIDPKGDIWVGSLGGVVRMGHPES
jgi:ligand-binding sensor domain-containing protein